MKIGIIVDGFGEVEALPELYARIRTQHDLLMPVHERRLQPLARPEQIALLAARRCRVLAARVPSAL